MSDSPPSARDALIDPPLLEVRHLVKDFVQRRRFGRGPSAVRAVDDVTFAVREGETFGLVGESGSGKSTLGRCILRLIEPSSGDVFFRGERTRSFSAPRMRQARRDMQIVFQDPYASLNPRMRAANIVEEPLIVHQLGSNVERRRRVAELFDLVGLEPDHLGRYPHEFSGGQRQRISIARALALNPALIVADEPVSALDVSVQAQVIQLLQDLQTRLSLTYLLIAHDLRLVEGVCDRVAVMYLGSLVEMATASSLFSNPAHPYTRALLSAAPKLDPDARPERSAFDTEAFDPTVGLREVGPAHWAAV